MKLFNEIANIREQYFEYPTEPVSPENAIARQNIHYLLGVIDALTMNTTKEPRE